MTAIGISKKFLKVLAFIVGALLIIFFSFQVWLNHHAESLIEKLVESQSNGKLALKVEKIKFNWMSRKIELQKAVFLSTDTSTAPVAYRFGVDRLRIELKAIFPLIFDKRIMIDSIRLVNPSINVIKRRAVRDTSASDSTLSIPQEMGRVYHSIQNALKLLEVGRFQIDNGRFSLIDATRPGEEPVTITRISLRIDNIKVDGDNDTQEKILFSDNIMLHTSEQDINFPDGRHRLSFREFRINTQNQRVEFDSCTIVASKGDSANSSFRVFFDRLVMTNIDFDTLYHAELIKADSVYCINPQFRLDVDLAKRTGPVQPPKLDELIQQLTGDMELANVMVKDGSFDINTMREGRPSSFTSYHNNFEMQGLRIRKNDPRPLTVESFAMAIRNFENFLRDSTYAIQFDSILFRDNRISLSNFSYAELKAGNVVNRIEMPQFELHGLSWDELVFQQQLKAEQVTLYRPVINYNLTHRRNQKSENIFKVLQDLGHVLQLDNLNIVDGDINLFFLDNAQLRLEHATTFVQAEQLIASRQIGGIQRSVHILNFSKGIFTSGGHRTELEDVVFTGGVNQLKAGRLTMDNHGRLLLSATNVLIPALSYDEESQNLILQELYWKEADIQLLPSGAKSRNPSGSFVLKNVHGGKTRFNRKDENHELSISIDTLSAREFSATAAHRLRLDGFMSAGSMLNFNNGQFELSARDFVLNDRAASTLRNVSFTRFNERDSIDVSIPAMAIVPDFNALLDGKLHFDYVSVNKPVIIAQLQKNEKTSNSISDHKTPDLRIGRLKMQQPDVQLTQTSEKGRSVLRWKGDPDNYIELSKVDMPGKTTNGMEIGGLAFSVDHFNFKSPKGKSFDTREGHITTELKSIRLQPNEAGGWDWQGKLEQLTGKNLRFDSLGKKSATLTVHSAQLNNLSINSLSLLNLREVLLKNTAFSMKDISGSYHTSTDLLDWHNATYDKNTRAFTVDSLSYRPALNREEFMKSRLYQADHLVATTGKIEVLPFQIDRFIQDTVIELGSVNIHHAKLNDFRDQRLPREPGVVKALPANLLKRIPNKLWIDTLKLIDGFVEYSEFNEKTNQEGSIRVNRLNARVTHLRNFQFEPNDSLHIRASAFLEDSLYTSLDLKESYTDTLGGFLMTARLGPGDLTILNPVLVPLAGAKVHSGILDSMHMRVVGREYLAFGEMYMYYRDLKIRIIRNADEKKKGFLMWIVNGLVNTVVRDHNNGKPGTVFFKRLRDRSAINYLVKITISGVGSSIGFKKNKKQVRRYKKEILNRDLPPIHLD